MLSDETYFKPHSITLRRADANGELDWIAELGNGDGGDRILLRELVLYAWAYSVSDSVTERALLQQMIDHRLAQLRVVANEGR